MFVCIHNFFIFEAKAAGWRQTLHTLGQCCRKVFWYQGLSDRPIIESSNNHITQNTKCPSINCPMLQHPRDKLSKILLSKVQNVEIWHYGEVSTRPTLKSSNCHIVQRRKRPIRKSSKVKVSTNQILQSLVPYIHQLARLVPTIAPSWRASHFSARW